MCVWVGNQDTFEKKFVFCYRKKDLIPKTTGCYAEPQIQGRGELLCFPLSFAFIFLFVPSSVLLVPFSRKENQNNCLPTDRKLPKFRAQTGTRLEGFEYDSRKKNKKKGVGEGVELKEANCRKRKEISGPGCPDSPPAPP